MFIALYEKIHFGKGETIKLFLIVWLGPISVLNLHGLETLAIIILYSICNCTVGCGTVHNRQYNCTLCIFRALMGLSHTSEYNSIVFPLQKWIFSCKAINNRTEATEVSKISKNWRMKSLGGEKSLSGEKSFGGEKSMGRNHSVGRFFLCIYFMF